MYTKCSLQAGYWAVRRAGNEELWLDSVASQKIKWIVSQVALCFIWDLIIGVEKISSTILVYSLVRTTGCPYTAWLPPAISLNNLEGLDSHHDKDVLLKRKEKRAEGNIKDFLSSETKFWDMLVARQGSFLKPLLLPFSCLFCVGVCSLICLFSLCLGFLSQGM